MVVFQERLCFGVWECCELDVFSGFNGVEL